MAAMIPAQLNKGEIHPMRHLWEVLFIYGMYLKKEDGVADGA